MSCCCLAPARKGWSASMAWQLGLTRKQQVQWDLAARALARGTALRAWRCRLPAAQVAGSAAGWFLMAPPALSGMRHLSVPRLAQDAPHCWHVTAPPPGWAEHLQQLHRCQALEQPSSGLAVPGQAKEECHPGPGWGVAGIPCQRPPQEWCPAARGRAEALAVLVMRRWASEQSGLGCQWAATSWPWALAWQQETPNCQALALRPAEATPQRRGQLLPRHRALSQRCAAKARPAADRVKGPGKPLPRPGPHSSVPRDMPSNVQQAPNPVP